MADVDFRVKFPLKIETVSTPIIVSNAEPTFSQLCFLNITDAIPAGTYELKVIYEWFMPDVNDSAIFRIISPVTAGTEYRNEPSDESDVVIRALSSYFTHAGGPIGFSFEAATTAGAQDLTVNYSQLSFERVL